MTIWVYGCAFLVLRSGEVGWRAFPRGRDGGVEIRDFSELRFFLFFRDEASFLSVVCLEKCVLRCFGAFETWNLLLIWGSFVFCATVTSVWGS